jgi:glycine betaine/proline transport system substrate-binding protein
VRIWLRWLNIALVAALLAAIGAFLLAYGPGLVEQPGRRAGAPGASTPALPKTGPEPGRRDTLVIGWTAWADAQVVTLMAERILERHTGLEVERQRLNIGIQYQSVAAGNIDIMLMAWLPLTHQNYWAKVRDRVVNLGPLYTGRLGWVVPDFVPREAVSSIRDLKRPEVARRLGGRIQGIDPGSGLMQASDRAMSAYGLDDYELVAASGAAMAAVLDRAVRQREWVVATAWQPHWVFARYNLRFLEDPEGVLGGHERIHALARQGFQADFPPGVTEFFSRMYLPADELAEILLAAQETSAEDAVAGYIEDHPRRIRYWLTGEVEEAGESPQPQ